MSKQKRLLTFIIDYKIKHGGVSPNLREMGDAIGGASTSMVNFYLDKLEERGKILPRPKRDARSVQVPGIKVVWVG
jgi:SOS-response transcriptional repressor LexA